MGVHTIYSASKGAIHGMTLPLARDLGRFGIRVVTLAPGAINTPPLRMLPQNELNKILSETPLSRPGEPSEMGESVMAIINSTFMTGTILNDNGG